MIGRTVAQYHILEKLGAGSMGVVYKAEHVRLKHLVVIKFLRPEFSGDRVRRERFLREAKLAATLDCQGVCQVIDCGDQRGDGFFLVMRYCEGLSLREHIDRGPLPLPKSVLFAIQIAEGLHATHAHGIVHRDIKPSNIIIGVHPDDANAPAAVDPAGGEATADMPETVEQAKITDFGLALLAGGSRLTLSQSILGTPAYMSPEQIRGEEVDLRTDIWSAGAVLYEMVTGVPPFGAEVPQAIMNAAQHREPRPVKELRPGTPPELAWIIGKAMRKDPADRYQDTNEMLSDLRLVRGRLVAGKGQGRNRGSWVLENRRRFLALGSGLLVAALALLVSRFVAPSLPPSQFRLGRPLQVTSSLGWEGAPAVSPDGSRIVYAGDQTGNLDLYLIPVRGGRTIQLTSDEASDSEPAWLPGGDAILFTSDRLDQAGIWKVGALGGDATLLLAQAADPAVSPAGDRLAFSRVAADGFSRIFVAPMSTPDDARQLTFDGDGAVNHSQPAWSPDGSTICYGTYGNLWLVAAAGGAPRELTSGGVADSSPTWAVGGEQIYFASQRGGTQALWRVGISGTAPVRLTPGSGPESDPSLAANGKVLAYTTAAAVGSEDVVILPRDTGRRIRLAGLDKTYQPTISADGSLLCYVSDRWEGRRELWLQALHDGEPTGDPRRLTDQPGRAAYPRFSPDGHWLAYYRIYEQGRGIWIVPTAGGAPRALTDHSCENVQPDWSPDGSRVVFASNRAGVTSLYAVEVVAGLGVGEPRRLTPPELPSFSPSWGPSGREIAFVAFGNETQLCVVAADGSETVRRLPLPCPPHAVHWDPAGGQLWVSAVWPDGPGLRAVDPATGRIAELVPPVHFETDISFARIHADTSGNLVVYSRPRRQGNIWILDVGGETF